MHFTHEADLITSGKIPEDIPTNSKTIHLCITADTLLLLK